MNKTNLAYLQLMRPANLFTAMADILAGVAAMGFLGGSGSSPGSAMTAVIPILMSLMAASVCLYAGGVVLNDAFDVEIDRLERPERPIPSGILLRHHVFIFGSILLIIGCLFALSVNTGSGLVAILLALSILAYDSYSKHSVVLGPLNMGLCRGLNLLLGMTIVYSLGDGGLGHFYVLMVLPVIYIAAITLISRGEVLGGNKKAILIAGFAYQLVILLLIILGYGLSYNIIQALPFILVFVFLTIRPLLAAYRENTPENIRQAVKSGVIAVIVLDASIAAGFSTMVVGLLVLLLLPLSMYVGKHFAVT